MLFLAAAGFIACRARQRSTGRKPPLVTTPTPIFSRADVEVIHLFLDPDLRIYFEGKKQSLEEGIYSGWPGAPMTQFTPRRKRLLTSSGSRKMRRVSDTSRARLRNRNKYRDHRVRFIYRLRMLEGASRRAYRTGTACRIIRNGAHAKSETRHVRTRLSLPRLAR